jgi:hypothetical protein
MRLIPVFARQRRVRGVTLTASLRCPVVCRMRLTLTDSVRFHILWKGLREALDGAESGAIWSRLSIALDSYSVMT